MVVVAVALVVALVDGDGVSSWLGDSIRKSFGAPVWGSR